MLRSRLLSWGVLACVTFYVFSSGSSTTLVAICLLVLTLTGVVYGFWLGYRYALARLDELDLERQHEGSVGDYLLDVRLERQAEKLRRQLAGLLASPRLYLRARKLLAPVTPLEQEDITAELELREVTGELVSSS